MKNRKLFEIIGLLSIVGSLIFVGIEISQNTTAVRGATQQAVSSQVTEMYTITAENERIAYVLGQSSLGISKAELSITDYVRFRAFVTIGLRRIENIYLQFKNGLLSENAFDRIGWDFYRSTLVREIWDDRKGHFEPDFVIFFENHRDLTK